LQDEENEKLKSKEIRKVVRKLIKLIHTGKSTGISMKEDKSASLGNRKTQDGKRNPRIEKEIKGTKQKKRSISVNRNPEIH
jgi:hypothetical protein